MKVLGFSVGHDKGAVIIENGKVLVGITQERISRIKHDGAYQGGLIPLESINYCLNALGISSKDISLWVYSTTEIIDDAPQKFFRIFPQVKTENLLFVPHHLAHAYSTFFSSGFEEAAVVVADASGSVISYKNTTHEWYDPKKWSLNPDFDWAEGISIYHFKKNSFNEVYKKWIKFPVPWNTNEDVSLGTVYAEATLQLVYEEKTHTWSAGKLMGLASYANQEIVDEGPNFVEELDDDMKIYNNFIYPKVTWKSDFYSRACVAGMYQKAQERASLHLAKLAKKFTSSENICVAGGSFLNCNSNQLILESGLYENCFFIPPADDSGIPLGCAWYGYQQITDITETKLISPYFGKTYDRGEILLALNNFPELEFKEYENFSELIENVSHWLTQNRVIGWFQGGSEIGPRALGNRSIIASPIQKWMIGHINSDIKSREWYRPFAPAVLFENQSDIFESSVFSPFMLVTTEVKPEWREKIPSVVHVDNSARHQSVTQESNPKFYELIKNFYTKTGVPVLLNTSFNGPSEPIVETPFDAIMTTLNRKIDYLVINNFFIKRPT